MHLNDSALLRQQGHPSVLVREHVLWALAQGDAHAVR